MAGLREALCEACREECGGKEKEQREERPMRAPSIDREQLGPQPNKESPTGGEKEKPPVVVTSRDGTSAHDPERQMDAQMLHTVSDERLTKLIGTGGQTALCYQLYTQGGVAT